MLKGKRILITGGTGFIGSHLTKELIKKKADITVIDIHINTKSIFTLESLQTKVDFQRMDITKKRNIETFIRQNNFDYIIHLAAESIVEKSYSNPLKAFKVNIMGTINILEGARKAGNIKGIIIASSDKAYGKTKTTYTEDSPLKGDHPYDVSKSCEDLISYSYFKTYGLPVVITRFGNVYGEGDFHMNRLIPGICKTIIKDTKLMIRSDGTYIRDYVYVKDVINGYLTILKNLKNIQGEAFNFSSGDTISVLQLLNKVEKISGKNIHYKILNTAKNEIPYQHLDDSKVKKLGWSNKYNLDNTIPKIISWYKKNI